MVNDNEKEIEINIRLLIKTRLKNSILSNCLCLNVDKRDADSQSFF